MRSNLSQGKISIKNSSCIIFFAIGDPGKTDSTNIVFNCYQQKVNDFSFVTSAYSLHLFWFHFTATSSYLSVTKMKVDGFGAISGRGFSRSGRGIGGVTCGGDVSESGGVSGGGTSI